MQKTEDLYKSLVSSKTEEMEAVRARMSEKIRTRIIKWPFWVRLIIMLVGTILCAFYHFVMTHWRFKECPKEECPNLSVFDNTNNWRLKEKPYMTNQQAMTLEVWIWLWIILIPEWRQLARKLAHVVQKCLKGLFNRYILQTPPNDIHVV